jgi:hypothetical protein
MHVVMCGMWMAVWFRKSRNMLNPKVRLTLVLAYIYGALMLNALFFGTAGTEALLLVAVVSSLLATIPITLFIWLFRGGHKGGVPTKHEYHAIMLINEGIPPSQIVLDRINHLQEQEDIAVEQEKAARKARKAAKAARKKSLRSNSITASSAAAAAAAGAESTTSTGPADVASHGPLATSSSAVSDDGVLQPSSSKLTLRCDTRPSSTVNLMDQFNTGDGDSAAASTAPAAKQTAGEASTDDVLIGVPLSSSQAQSATQQPPQSVVVPQQRQRQQQPARRIKQPARIIRLAVSIQRGLMPYLALWVRYAGACVFDKSFACTVAMPLHVGVVDPSDTLAEAVDA